MRREKLGWWRKLGIKGQVILLSLGAVGLFAGIRVMPVEQCEFLHYGEYLNEGELEICGFGETAFFDLETVRYPVVMQFEALGEAVAGESLTCRLYLETARGEAIPVEDIAVSHTEKIHLMAVDPSLTDYQHVHPQPTGSPGEYEVSLAPKRAGQYRVFVDFISLKSARRVLARASFEVSGRESSPEARENLTLVRDGYRFELLTGAGGFIAGRDTEMVVDVRRVGGGPVTFGTVMGAYAHLVAFDEKRSGFAHLHPLRPDVSLADTTDPDLGFLFNAEEPGYYRIWAQLMLDGVERYVPFDVVVSEA